MNRKVRLLFIVFFGLAYPAFSLTASPKLRSLFENAKVLFWQVEPEFNVNSNPIENLPPLAENDADVVYYRRAAQAAERFLVAAGPKSKSEGVPIMLYFAAMSYSRINEHEKVLLYINRLLTEYSDYKRPRMAGYPEEDRPVKADLLHLKLWHTSQLKQYEKEAKRKSTLAVLKEVAQSGIQAMQAKASMRPPQQYLDLEWLAPTPDQLRTAALPSVKEIVASIHDELLPAVIKVSGAKAARDYLRELGKSGEPVASYANTKLLDIDKTVLAQYRQEAEKALREKQFNTAKTIYRRIMDEYSGTEAARLAEADLKQASITEYRYVAEVALNEKRFDDVKATYRRLIAEFPESNDALWAEGELKKIVPVAVAYYKSEGEKNFRAAQPDQFMKPQSKSREFYEKAYKEDPEGAQAAEMLYNWTKALATEKNQVPPAIGLMEEWMKKYPANHPMRVQAMWQLAFFYATQRNRYSDGIKLMDQIVKEYPQSPEAAESLWHAAMLWTGLTDGAREGYEKGLPYLEKYYKDYPNAPRWPNALKWINRFKEKL